MWGPTCPQSSPCQAMVASRHRSCSCPGAVRGELRMQVATPGRCPLWGKRMPGAPGSTPGRHGCKRGAGLSPQSTALPTSPAILCTPLCPLRPHILPQSPPHLHRHHSPHALRHRPHGLLRHEDMAGEAAQQRMFGNEAEVAVGKAG